MLETKLNLVKPITRVVVTYRSKVLFVKRSITDNSRPGQWENAGGGVDIGETFEQAARREVLEETGLELNHLVFDHSYTYTVDGLQRISVLFRGEAKDNNVKLSFEHEDYTWRDESDFVDLQLADHDRAYFKDFFKNKMKKGCK